MNRWYNNSEVASRTLVCIIIFLAQLETFLCQGRGLTVKAILNGTALLPCDIAPPLSRDEVIMVAWYTEDLKPLYSFDRRGGSSEPLHWKDESRLIDRGYFRTSTQPAVLVIDRIQETDEGLYRCRVDFMRSPTRNVKVFLTIIVPPEKPIILTEKLKEISTIAGPYEEGSDVKLICKVTGGKPAPVISWKKDDDIQSSEVQIPISEKKSEYRLKELTIYNLNRTNLHKSLACQASNDEINNPVSTSVILDMYLKPSNVSIIFGEESMSTDRVYKIVCQTVGSRPEAIVEWWKEGHRLANTSKQVLEEGNITLSTLSIRPTMKDHNKTLTCRAFNPKLPEEVAESSLRIDVTFPPSLKLNLGSNMNPEDIEEGDDVYFECNVTANPPAYKVEWWHNGLIVPHNGKPGIIPSHKALILQGVKRQMTGNYTCTASSVEGDGTSNLVQLSVMYKPICKRNQKYVYGVGKEENAQVICEVDSFPLPDSYKWLFNHTKKAIPESRYSAVDNRRGISILTFSPQTDLDYGILMCWATNAVGTQSEPCLFHIIPAGQPDPPYNCTVYNETTDSIEIVCKEGFDGGQTQYFIVEVNDLETGHLLTNLTSNKLSFKINRLSPGKSLRMNIYAANVRGKSESVLIEATTLGSAQKQTGIPSKLHIGSLIGVLLGLVVISCILTIVILGAVRNRHSSTNISVGRKEDKCVIGEHEEIFSPYEMDEKTPDVIQCNNNKGIEYETRRIISGDTMIPLPSESSKDSADNSTRNIVIPNGEIQTSNCSTSMRRNEVADDEGTRCNMKTMNRNRTGSDRRKPNSESYATQSDVAIDKITDCAVTSKPPWHREVITVCTPLFQPTDQESCV